MFSLWFIPCINYNHSGTIRAIYFPWLQRKLNLTHISASINWFKGVLISASFVLLWLKSLKKEPNHDPEHYPPKEKMLRVVIWHLFFADLSQRGKLSGIKPPLDSMLVRNKVQNRNFEIFSMRQDIYIINVGKYYVMSNQDQIGSL